MRERRPDTFLGRFRPVTMLLPRCLTLLLLTPLIASQAGDLQAVYHRGSVRRGPVPLAAPNAPLSAVQCGALCSRYSTCRSWSRDPATDLCAVYPAPDDGQEGVLDTEGYQLPTEPPPTPQTPPAGYTTVVGYTAFRALTVTGSKTDGATQCLMTDPSAVLASPGSDEEVKAVLAMVAAAPECETYLGIMIQGVGSFVDHAGQPLVIQARWFDKGVFPDYKSSEPCVVAKKDGTVLKKHPCDHNHCAACQVPLLVT